MDYWYYKLKPLEEIQDGHNKDSIILRRNYCQYSHGLYLYSSKPLKKPSGLNTYYQLLTNPKEIEIIKTLYGFEKAF